MNTTTIFFSLFAELIAAAMAVVIIFRQAQKFDSIHHSKGQHLRKIGAQVCVFSALGMWLSYSFAFNADNVIFSTIASIMFMTFMYPLVVYRWTSNSSSEPHSAYEGSRTLTTMSNLGESMILLSVATWAACMNSTYSDLALITGAAVGLNGTGLVLFGHFRLVPVLR